MPAQFLGGRGLNLGLGSGGAVAAGWWVVAGKTCVAAYKPKGAASLAASYINLANPGTYDAAPGVAPTLGADGWVFDDGTQYLDTGIIPVNDQSWSAIVRFYGATTAGQGSLLGCCAAGGGAPYFLIQPNRATNQVLYGNGNFALVSTPLTSGVLAVSGAYGYRNGEVESDVIGVAGGALRALYIGAMNQNGAAAGFGLCKIQAIAIYSDTLTAGEVAAVSAAMAAL